jgi:hypothetical protein
MARSLDTATAAAIVSPSIYPMWLVRLDFVGEPVYIHTGIGNITFTSGYDAPLNGLTFLGIGNVGSIGAITDAIDGSQSVTLTLPGVDLSNDYLHQINVNSDLWQRQLAYLWLATLDSNGNMLGKPARVKSGRIDQLNISIDPNSGGTIEVIIESQQAYAGQALGTRYIENKKIDTSDNSQAYAYDLANKVPTIGQTSSNASSQLISGGPSYGQYLANFKMSSY